MRLQGSQKLAVLLCKFSDTARTEPNPVSFYKDLFVRRGTGGLNDYWDEASFGAINLDGSQVFGWTVLDTKRADYLAAHPGRWDKIRGAIEGFKLDSSKFTAVVAIFNVDVTDGGAAGGVLVGPGDANVTFLAHETGHLFGLEHSFDTSKRKAETWSTEGEYFDRYDVMSAMTVNSDRGHRFSPRGPLLNAANLDRMGWLPESRIWRPAGRNSSAFHRLEIVALEHPEVVGFLAAAVGGVIVEFRIPSGWDSGLTRPAVLIHAPANPNSYIIASDPVNHVNEWQPGQIYGPRIPSPPEIEIGGTWIIVVAFDLLKKTALLEVRIKATRIPFVDIEHRGPILGGGGYLVVLVNGKIVRIPIPNPVINVLEDGTAIYTQMERMGQAQELPVQGLDASKALPEPF
jgi:hypothetical protein